MVGFQYFLFAQVIEGIDAETLKKELEKQSMDEMNHAKIVGDRIITWWNAYYQNYRNLKLLFFSSSRRSDGPQCMVELALEGERCAIEKYKRLTKKYHMKDLVTREIFEHLMTKLMMQKIGRTFCLD